MSCLLVALLGLTVENQVGVGADYSGARYAVADTVTRDTGAQDTELRLFWQVRLDRAESGRDRSLDAENEFEISTGSVRERLNLNGDWRLSRKWRFNTGYEGELRYYHPGWLIIPDSSARRSYFNNVLDAGLGFSPWAGLEFSAGNAAEFQFYLPEDSFNHSYFLNRLRLVSDLRPAEVLEFSISYRHSRLSAARETADNYFENTISARGDWDFNWSGRLGLDGEFIRRRYRAGYKSFREWHPVFSLSQELGSAFGVNLEGEVRWTFYDETSAVYQPVRESRSLIQAEWRPAEGITVRAGPELEVSRAILRPSDQDYREFALCAGSEFLRSGRLGFFIEDRAGFRRYSFADSGFQSNYRFNELRLSGNGQLFLSGGRGLSLDLLLSVAPEWHTEAVDNLAALSAVLELKYQF